MVPGGGLGGGKQEAALDCSSVLPLELPGNPLKFLAGRQLENACCSRTVCQLGTLKDSRQHQTSLGQLSSYPGVGNFKGLLCSPRLRKATAVAVSSLNQLLPKQEQLIRQACQ